MVDLSSVPHKPGCYIFKDKQGKTIYIGKAKDLRKRVASYFTKNSHDPKTELLIASIRTMDYIVTDSETEALILESNLIKKNQPKYNINLKDSKRYAYLHMTSDDYPRLLLARKRKPQGMYFGPFISAQERDYVKTAVIRTFKIRTCKRFPKKPCLRYHIKLCDAPCVNKITNVQYNRRIRDAIRVLKGRTKDLIQDLKTEMEKSSKNQRYERALELRDQLFSLKNLSERQNMERQRRIDEDLIVSRVDEGQVYLLLFNIYKGTLLNKSEFIFEANINYFNEFLVQYYAENPIPKVLILDRSPDPAIQHYLEHLRGTKVDIVRPKRGERRHLLLLANKNLEISFFGNIAKVEALQKKLRMQDPPSVIECFDISHISGTSTTGSMVQFRNGRPDKSNYRRFRIRSYKGSDDYKGISEVVKRRYSRLSQEYRQMPSLIIIDGGKGQLKATTQELDKLNLRIPIISIAKRDEDIYFPHSRFPMKLDKKDTALKFIQEIRDEAHRFAINYSRLLRQKNNMENN